MGEMNARFGGLAGDLARLRVFALAGGVPEPFVFEIIFALLFVLLLLLLGVVVVLLLLLRLLKKRLDDLGERNDSSSSRLLLVSVLFKSLGDMI